ncbi:sensitive to high expression protein 9 [Coprinopsis cinerea AmutBmut pab1-1]|nr:sensitive to high expression protein 9 [Coprinopsis cinerea AmutBmut pab1-1]
MLRSSISRSFARPVSVWRSLPKRNYSAEQQSGKTVVDDKEVLPAISESNEPPSQNHPASTSSPPLESTPRIGSTDKSQLLSHAELETVKQRIREWTEQTAIAVRTRADGFTANAKTHFSQLGQHLNRATGYEEIEALKREVVVQENRINEARLAARKAKTAYEEAVLQRSKSQREVNDLLQRKSMWTDHDVSRFTTLVREDHLYEQEEARAKAAVNSTEDAVEKEFSQLMRLILARYHEEQVWSDKIRSASTYGQLAALGLNLIVFILAIILVEPWKRKRLAQTFERKVEELSEDYLTKLEESTSRIRSSLEGQEALILSLAQQLAASVATAEPTPVEAAEPPPPYTPSDNDEPQPSPLPQQLKPPFDSLSQRTWELVAVGTSAFVVGVVGSILFGR